MTPPAESWLRVSRSPTVGATSRCAFCHGAFARADDDAPRSCVGCGTLLHAPCWHEAGRCTTLGCRGPGVRLRVQPPALTWRFLTAGESAIAGFVAACVLLFLLR